MMGSRNTRASQRGGQNVTVNGFCDPDFKTVEKVLSQQLRQTPGGAAAAVYHRGKLVVDLWGGYSDEEGSPWLRDTMAPSFSTTKGVTSTLLHLLADRGLIDYDEKVATYWPRFAQAGKENITVRQVLSHQSGLYHIRHMVDGAPRMLDWEHMIEAIELAEPIHEPGTRTGYHGFTYGFIVGELIQQVTGKKFTELLQSELATPLGLDGLYIGAPEDELHRAAQLIQSRSAKRPAHLSIGFYLEHYIHGVSAVLRRIGVDTQISSLYDALSPRGMREFDIGSAESLRTPIPAANGLFTARSLAALYALLAGKGQLDGVRLLSEDTVKTVGTLEPFPGKTAVIPINMRWRLGYHGVFTSQGFRDGAFGHFGFGGSGGWADPELDLAVALVTNSGTGSAFGDRRIAKIGGAAIESANARWGSPTLAEAESPA